MDDRALERVAARVRDAMESGAVEHPELAIFPLGAGFVASLLLGRHLQESGLGPVQFVEGWSVTGHRTHAWVERKSLLVDVTADQFSEVGDRVLVTRDATWHSQKFPNREIRPMPSLMAMVLADPAMARALRTFGLALG